MPDFTLNNKRIAKNMIQLYLRMILIMFINLYLSRVLISALGVVDYGIYNVVGGVVAMFTFISSAMSNSISRYLTYSLGKGEKNELNKVFVTAFYINILIAFIIIVLAETIGLWFLNTKLVIPQSRFSVANWIYQFSILATALTIICVPYKSDVIAHEKMSVFAYISITDSILTLLFAILVRASGFDRLFFYASLIVLVKLTEVLLYAGYCTLHFEETKIKKFTDKTYLKKMTSFAGWSLLGNFAWICYTQGVNFLLNIFSGPIVNAARAVATQVQSALKSLVASFQTSINPQITKSYATNDINRMQTLIFTGSKTSFYIMLCLALPILLETEKILEVWLVTPPEHTANFIKLSVLIILIDPLANPIGIGNNATGDIKTYQIVESGLLLLNIPVSFIFLKLGNEPEIVFVVQLIISVIVQIVRLLLVKNKLNIKLLEYTKKVIFRILLVSLCASVFPYYISLHMGDSLIEVTFIIAISIISVIISAYFLGLTNVERNYVKKIANSFSKKKNL